MDTTRQIILIAGICLAVAVYLIWKYIEWRRANQSSFPAPKMRPATSLKKKANALDLPEPKFRDSVAPKAAPISDAAQDIPPLPVSPSIHDEPILPPQPAATSVPSVDPVTPLVPAATVARAATLPPYDDEYEEYPYAGQDDYAFGSATPVLAAMTPHSVEARDRETRDLRNAGYYSPHAWHNFSAWRYLLIIGPILVCGLLLLIAPEPLEPWLMGGLILLPFIGWALPGVYIQNKAAARRQQIANGMPDMLDLLNMCVSQGMTVPKALRRVSKDITPVYPDLAKELTIVTEQARVGSLDQALANFSRRVDVPEVHSFTSLLTQTERLGTSVSGALEEYSDNIRTAMRQRADEKANSAAFKLLFPTVFCLMPAVYMFLMGPAVVQLTDFYNNGRQELDATATVQRVLNQER
ncbi:MAG: type II secretion system F family protein [Planctomycetaceae bacterium]|nr:type II secretion system F family protein [Planctomycetaceae bacterium]